MANRNNIPVANLMNNAFFVTAPTTKPVTLTLPPHQPILTAEPLAAESLPGIPAGTKRATVTPVTKRAPLAAKPKANKVDKAVTSALKAKMTMAQAAKKARKAQIAVVKFTATAALNTARNNAVVAIGKATDTQRVYSAKLEDELNAAYPAENLPLWELSGTGSPKAKAYTEEMTRFQKALIDRELKKNKTQESANSVARQAKYRVGLYAKERAELAQYSAAVAAAKKAGKAPPAAPKKGKKAEHSLTVRSLTTCDTMVKAFARVDKGGKLTDKERKARQLWVALAASLKTI